MEKSAPLSGGGTKTVAIIQARQKSSRFPGKVLKMLGDRPVLSWVYQRASKAECLDQVVVATSDDPADDEIVAFCQRESIPVFRGPENDVLKRYFLAAQAFEADTVVRVTADCPFIDPKVLDRVIGAFREHKVDYASNTLHHTYPDGFDCEVMSFKALQEAETHAAMAAEREHVTPYLKNRDFKKHSVELPQRSEPGLRVTVDYPEDLECLNLVYRKLQRHDFGWQDVVDELKRNPEISKLNANIVANEGYYRTLASEPIEPLGYQFENSVRLFESAKKIIPDASQTFSKGKSQISIGASPFFTTRGKGAYLWDVDGNRFIDYTMGLGPCILGYSDEDVNAAVHEQIDRLSIASLCSPLEQELAEMIIDLIPCAEMVRFGKNGSDVTAAAVRLARAYTKRDQILCAGYHGWQDWYIGTTTRNLGVPQAVQQLTDTFSFNKIESLKEKLAKHQGNVAAVILEPVTAEAPLPGYLDEVIELAHANGALVIFDEVITGFRVGMSGAQGLYHVRPDLACFGKALANGYPIAAVTGRREVMKLAEEIFFSFTMGGEMASIAAAKATIQKLAKTQAHAAIWEQGQRLLDGYGVLSKIAGLQGLTTIQGLPPRSILNFHGENERHSLLMKTYFQQECAARGLLFSGSHFISYSHTSEIVDQTLRIYGTVLTLLKENLHCLEEMIKGAILSPVFRKA